jgi:hypothetical protein
MHCIRLNLGHFEALPEVFSNTCINTTNKSTNNDYHSAQSRRARGEDIFLSLDASWAIATFAFAFAFFSAAAFSALAFAALAFFSACFFLSAACFFFSSAFFLSLLDLDDDLEEDDLEESLALDVDLAEDAALVSVTVAFALVEVDLAAAAFAWVVFAFSVDFAASEDEDFETTTAAAAALAAPCLTTTQLPKPAVLLKETRQRFLALPPAHLVPAGSCTVSWSEPTLDGACEISR